MASCSTGWVRSSRRWRQRAGVGYVREGYVDLNYDDSGGLVIERNKGAWDPEEVARRAVRLATRNEVGTVEGNTLPLAVQSICIHGDAPNSGEVARRVRQRLEEAGIGIAPVAPAVARLNRIRAFGTMGGIGIMSAEVLSPLPGLVATVHVKTGDAVASGDPVVTLQSMKMEIPITAESDGTIAEILVSEGDEIDTGAVIARFS